MGNQPQGTSSADRMSDQAAALAQTGLADAVLLFRATETAPIGGLAGMSCSPSGMSPAEMIQLSTTLAGFSRSVAHAAAMHAGTDPDQTWRAAVAAMDHPGNEFAAKTAILARGGES